jgi:pimeloyl-ACP methyl ester carboxylesterase
MRKRQLLFIGGLGVLVLLAGIGIHAYTRLQSILPPLSDPSCCLHPSDPSLDVTTVQLTTTDQLTLACWYLPSHNRAAILVLHGEGGNRQTMLPHVALLAQHRYGVLSCDRRGHGASMGAQRSWGWLDSADVGPMLAYLQQRPDVDPGRIGVFGFSIGSQIALRAAAQYPIIHAVVADGPIPATTADLFPPESVTEWPRAALDWLDNWFVDRFLEHTFHMAAPLPVVQAIAQRPAYPLLLITTGQTGYGRELRQGAWFYSAAREPKQLWELPDVGHGEGLAKHPTEYAEHVLSFFDHALVE